MTMLHQLLNKFRAKTPARDPIRKLLKDAAGVWRSFTMPLDKGQTIQLFCYFTCDF